MAFLVACDGHRSIEAAAEGCGLPTPDARVLFEQLSAIGGAADARSLWRWFLDVAQNPPPFPPPLSVEDAYATPRWRPEFAPQNTESIAPEPSHRATGRGRRSASLELGTLAVQEPTALSRDVLSLAVEVMRPRSDGHLRFSSAGAMWPLHVWVIYQNLSDKVECVLIDHFAGRRLSVAGSVTRAELKECFVHDCDLASALDAGAAVIVITAEVERMCGKYGSRGLNYMLIEVGQAIAHAEFLAPDFGLITRAIGGFIEERVSTRLPLDGLVPLCCLLLAHADA